MVASAPEVKTGKAKTKKETPAKAPAVTEEPVTPDQEQIAEDVTDKAEELGPVAEAEEPSSEETPPEEPQSEEESKA